MLVCKKCKAVKIEDKWIPSTNLRRNVTFTLCPDCTQELKQTSHGVVMLDGIFFRQNTTQSMELIKTEEMRARKTNVYARVVQISKGTNPITIKTTNSQLAIQIGKQFKRQFKGDLQINENPKTGVTVRWTIKSEKIEAKNTSEENSTHTPA